MIENIRLSFQGIATHKLRSFLTMLGIIIGIASIIAIVSTIRGTNEQIKNNLIGSGNNTVTVQLYQGDWPYEFQYMGVPIDIPTVSEGTRKEIMELSEVEDSTLLHIRNYAENVFRGNLNLSGARLFGVESNYFSVTGMRVSSGRGFTKRDYSEFRKVAILDSKAANTLFEGESAIGRTIELSMEPFVVVGIAEDITRFEPVINSLEDFYMYADNTSGRIFVPIACWPIMFGFDEQQTVVVKAVNTDLMTAVGKKTEDILNARIPNESAEGAIRYKSDDLLEQAKRLQDLSAATNTMLIWIAGISLLVGGIGVMNIMLVSVTERTREIGLKKAVGAPKKRIMVQFLTEASVLTSIGGVIGVAVGIALAFVISKVAEVPVAISVPAIIIAVAFSVVVGLVFGLLPSVKAANLNPIDALRYE
ncbi:MAG: ABC transporter permease [Oscillospiraceae bacterium]|nr:ABC transporter permease [Oscillospiraceae bacterium]